MADQTAASLRVRVTADIADIKQGLAVVRGQVASLSAAGSAPASRKNPIKDLGDDAVSTSRVLAVLQPQITDIVTSLQGGMSFTTVALQQGGQIRDVAAQMGFGIKDIGKALLGLVTPTTLTVAAVAALGYAWYQASEQAIAFEKSIQSTGNRAGLTAVEIGQFASEAARATNSSAGAANEAALAVAATGRVTANAFRDTTIAVLNTAELTGQSVDSIAEKFAALQGDPVKAMMKLDETLNFVTIDLYNQVKAQEAQGDAQAAAATVAKAAADASVEALAKVDEKLNWLQRSWKATKLVADQAWISFKGSIGLATEAEEIQNLLSQRRSAQRRLDNLRDRDVSESSSAVVSAKEEVNGITAQINAIQQKAAKERADAEIAADAQAAQRVAVAQAELIDSQASNATKRANEIKKVQDENLRARLALMLEGSKKSVAAADQIAQKEAEQIAAINKKYADKKTPSTANASRNLGLQQFENAASQEMQVIAADTKALQMQYQFRSISASEYYARLRELTQKGTDVQAGALEKEIAYLKARTDTGKDSIATTQKIGELETKLANVRTKGAAEIKGIDAQEKNLRDTRVDAMKDYQASLDKQLQSVDEEMAAMAARVGMGDREAEIQQRLAQVTAKTAGEMARLAKAERDANGDTEKIADIKQQMAAVQKLDADMRASILSGYQTLSEAEGTWSEGARAALINYMVEVSNVAGSIKDALTSAFKGGEDAFVQFVKTSKLSFSSLADSIIEDMARIAYRQAASGLLGDLFGGLFGNGLTGLSGGKSLDLSGAINSLIPSAKGNVFSAPSLSAMSGKVLTSPVVFPFANGATFGIAGEAGPEAIMPLKRTSSGRLGVEVVASVAAGSTRSNDVNVEVINNGQPVTAQATTSQQPDGSTLVKLVLNAVADDIASGGRVAKAGKGRFGWKDQV